MLRMAVPSGSFEAEWIDLLISMTLVNGLGQESRTVPTEKRDPLCAFLFKYMRVSIGYIFMVLAACLRVSWESFFSLRLMPEAL